MIFSNLAITLDGKIAPADRSLFPLGTKADRLEMFRLRSKADVVLMGASTLRSFRKPCLAHGHRHQPINAVLTRTFKGLDSSWPFFTTQKPIVLFESISNSTFRQFSPLCTLVRIPKEKSVAKSIVKILRGMKLKKILVEGGGDLMWHFAKDNLVDRYHVTLTPRILGGKQAPTLVDGAGFEPQNCLNLRLLSAKKRKNEIFLVYGKSK